MRPPNGATEGLRVVLVAHQRGLVGLGQLASRIAPVVAGAARAFGSITEPRVGLHSDEVVSACQLEEPIAHPRLELERACAGLGSVFVLQVGEGKGHAGRDSGARADGGRAQPVRLEQVVDGPLRPLAVVGVSRRVDAQQPAARTQSLWFVDGAGERHPVAEGGRRTVAVALEQGRKALRGEASLLVHPPWQREVVEGDHRDDAVLEAGVEDAAIVSEGGPRELAFSRLDARPFDAESKRGQAEAGQHRDVLWVAVVEVAGVARRLTARRGGDVLPPPPVGVGVAALGLVGGDRGAEQEGVRETQGVSHSGDVSARGPCPARANSAGSSEAKIDKPPGGN